MTSADYCYIRAHDQTGTWSGQTQPRIPVPKIDTNLKLQQWRELLIKERAVKKNWYYIQHPQQLQAHNEREHQKRLNKNYSFCCFSHVGTIDDLKKARSSSNPARFVDRRAEKTAAALDNRYKDIRTGKKKYNPIYPISGKDVRYVEHPEAKRVMANPHELYNYIQGGPKKRELEKHFLVNT